MGRFSTKPIAPSPECAQTQMMEPAKRGSCMLGVAIEELAGEVTLAVTGRGWDAACCERAWPCLIDGGRPRARASVGVRPPLRERR